MPFAETLIERARTLGSSVCLGLDPRVDTLPSEFGSNLAAEDLNVQAAAARDFCLAVLGRTAPLVAAVKPQAAFFEALQAPGYAAFLDVCRAGRELGVPVIADVKRGDIGSTAEAYARGLFGSGETPPVADAVTVNPWLGDDGVLPFVEAAKAKEGGVFVLVKTSNPSSGLFQDLVADGRPLHDHVAEATRRWNDPLGISGYGPVGAVVGATYPEHLEAMRRAMPGVLFLVPGYGAQGANAADVARAFDADGVGAIVNASRSLTFPWRARNETAPTDWLGAVEAATVTMRDALAKALERRA